MSHTTLNSNALRAPVFFLGRQQRHARAVRGDAHRDLLQGRSRRADAASLVVRATL